MKILKTYLQKFTPLNPRNGSIAVIQHFRSLSEYSLLRGQEIRNLAFAGLDTLKK